MIGMRGIEFGVCGLCGLCGFEEVSGFVMGFVIVHIPSTRVFRSSPITLKGRPVLHQLEKKQRSVGPKYHAMP